MNIFDLFGRLTIEGIDKVDGQLRSVEDRLNSTGKAMTSMGKTLSMTVTAPLTALGIGAFKAAGDFDQAFRQVNVMLGASSEQAAEYKQRILEISSATGIAATDVVSAYYQIVSAGYRGADSLDILETAMKGATGGAADATATTAALTKAMNIFQLEGVEGSSKAMDSFFGIVDAGLLSFEEMANAFPRAAGNAAGLGVSIEETGAALATLTKFLGSTEQAATATDAMFRTLISPSEALQKLYQEWGVADGPEAIARFGGLSGVLEKVREVTGDNVVAIRELFASDEAMRGVLPLLTYATDDFAGALDAVVGATGRTGEAVEEMTEGPGFQWQQFTNNMKNALIELGGSIADTIGPALVSMTDLLRGVVDWFGKLSPQMQKAIVITGAVAAAAGPVLLALGLAAQGLAAVIGLTHAHTIALAAHNVAMAASKAAMGAVTAAQWLLNAAMTANPIGIVIVAIGALVAALVWLVKNNDDVRGKLVGAWEGIKNFFSRIWNAAGDGITALFEGGMGDILRLMMLPVTWPIEIAKHWDAIKDAMLKPITAARDAIAGIMDRIKELLSPLTAAQSAGGMVGIGGLNEIQKLQGIEGYANGGPIPEPTLLYGLRSQKPYAIAGESGPEKVSPAGQAGTTINNQFSIAQLVVREEADVDRIAERLYHMQQLRTRYA